MKYNEQDINKILDNLKIDFRKDNGNGVLLTSYEISILIKYNFDYTKYTNMNELIFDIDNYLNEEGSYLDADDLEDVLDTLSEFHYYNETNK